MLAMEDDQGIVFLVENAQQFWSGMWYSLICYFFFRRRTELEDTLNFQTNEPPTLSLLDSTLMKFLGLCAAYHGTWRSIYRDNAIDMLLSDLRTISAEPVAA